ncbi:MAG: glycosyltransferase [Ignavibacteria bacterium]|nr:glycosyltransferase [Ignavibacteria bacterium]
MATCRYGSQAMPDGRIGNGRDLYGLDVLVSAFSSIQDPEAALCIAVGDVVDTALLQNVLALASNDARITFVRDLNCPLAPFVQHAHIVVRPTRTEGGPSLTLSEALELGRWAVGSDAGQRPDGTVLFLAMKIQRIFRVLSVSAFRRW